MPDTEEGKTLCAVGAFNNAFNNSFDNAFDNAFNAVELCVENLSDISTYSVPPSECSCTANCLVRTQLGKQYVPSRLREWALEVHWVLVKFLLTIINCPLVNNFPICFGKYFVH